MTEDIRRKILEMIDSGAITAAQGLELMHAADDDDAPEALPTPIVAGEVPAPGAPETPVEAAPPPAPDPVPVEDAPAAAPASSLPMPAEKYRHWWRIPLWVGVAVSVIGALIMYSAFQASGAGFWFACAWFPFLLGIALLGLAFTARTAPWLHVRIRQKPGERPQNIAISLPLPIGLLRWVMRLAKDRIPGPAGVNYEEVLQALENTSPDAPFYVEANQADGEHVEIYIG